VTLLPEPVRQRLAAAEIVLIVPHHILHYLPFAALVSQPDNQRRGPLEMVQPGFVADASYSVTYAPSLRPGNCCAGRTTFRFARWRPPSSRNFPARRPCPACCAS
jgi:hypothetical protein